MTKHIFVTGGVVSSLGKGLTSAALGMLLESRGLRIAMQKFDPYLNVDPGTMSPFQHGEVFVTEDGAETDLDLGHYERFTNAKLRKTSNITTGRVYLNVIERERRGDFLGGTVQVVPHITDEIKRAIRQLDGPDTDVAITEIGGTVGDIESLPFLEAIRQFSLDEGRANVLYVHLTLLPFLRASAEVKTKPTQHSVGKLREIGIQPDVLICRTEVPVAQEMRDKISLFCNVPKDAVIEEKDVDYSIYELPLVLHRQGVDALILNRLGLTSPAEPKLDAWTEMLRRIRSPSTGVKIAVVGKYLGLQDAYKSLNEALDHAGIANDARVVLHKVSSELIEKDGPERHLSGVDGILVPGGFGDRGIEGKIEAVRFARLNRLPFFGICLGMQCATIEFARNVAGLARAHSTEFDRDTPYPVISMLAEQRLVVEKGGTMRLGAYPCALAEGSLAAKAYGAPEVRERHRHRFEFNGEYRLRLEQAGLRVTGLFTERNLVEIVELPAHPWFVGVQFHPEFQSKPVKAHPLFREFVAAAVRSAGKCAK
ncbi:MAG: CTP synthase [Planctomycetes bacterium]|nr:CTP synthase [Planctomycetota bacterium]